MASVEKWSENVTYALRSRKNSAEKELRNRLENATGKMGNFLGGEGAACVGYLLHREKVQEGG